MSPKWAKHPSGCLNQQSKSILMSLQSLIFNVSNEKEIVTFIAHLGEKNHFVVIRNGKLQSIDSASEFEDVANHYFDVDGFTCESMSLDGQIYEYLSKQVTSYIKTILRHMDNKSQG